MEPSALDVKDFVIYDRKSQERLGHTVPSQWGPVTLFELCKRLGYVDTALAFASHGVAGCSVEANELGPYAEVYSAHCKCEQAPSPSFSDPWACFDPWCRGTCSDPTCSEPWAQRTRWHPPATTICECCRRNESCEVCCFGWPVDQGTWMEDWDAHLGDAVKAAEEAAEQPFLRGLLDLSCSGAELRFMSTEGMARLLDIAILTGDKETFALLRDLRAFDSFVVSRETGACISLSFASILCSEI
eukprot:Skav216798  [mRNA]  locus=scaffold2110:28615:30201:- [translate_table: standard]